MNLNDFIDDVMYDISSKLIDNKHFEQTEYCYWDYYSDEFGRGWFSICPDKIIYVKNESECYLTWKVQLELIDKNINEYTKIGVDIIKEILDTIKYKPIKDEDFHAIDGQYEVKEEKEFGDLIVSCYICPDLRDGWWENHIL